MDKTPEKDELIPFSGLWVEKLKDGRNYLAGKISPTCRMVILPNRYKTKGSKEPDYRVFFAKATSDKTMRNDNGVASSQDAPVEEFEVDDDDIDLDSIDF